MLVQAYTFTSTPILTALAEATSRGIDVRVILDRSGRGRRPRRGRWLADHGIAPLIDDQVGIAHNKVLVIDGGTVITGSFATPAPPRTATPRTSSSSRAAPIWPASTPRTGSAAPPSLAALCAP